MHALPLHPPLLFALAAPVLAQPAPADPKIEWLRQNAVRIRSISPADRDFSDLQPLKKILRNARVVLLGEPTHGAGAAFPAKTRLIQFLHEEMGFDVLAFESGLYDCGRAWEALQAGGGPGQGRAPRRLRHLDAKRAVDPADGVKWAGVQAPRAR